MASSSGRLGFGMFMAPFHPAIQNPTLSLQRDLELIELLDRLGFDEVWVGEHHSAGTEIISSPEVFIAAAAERTRRIKLGTGVVSLPYHHPLWVADRAMLLDHLTRGRFMLGVGPGSLPTDAAMVGLEPELLRPRLEEGLQAVLHLLSERRAAHHGDRVVHPERRRAAAAALHQAAHRGRRPGRGVTDGRAPGRQVRHQPAHHRGRGRAGHRPVRHALGRRGAAGGSSTVSTTDRSQWRVLSMVHLAETEEQARKDVAFGITDWFRYFQHVAAFPQMAVRARTSTR